MTEPREHCGHLPPQTGLSTVRTECVLRPGHSGSHADDVGCRWWPIADEQPAAAPAGPAPATDRAAVLLWAADQIDAGWFTTAATATAALRRLAGEAQQDEAACAHPHGRPGLASLLEHVGIDTSGGVTVDGQTVAAPCTCGAQPGREAQQDPTQDGEDGCVHPDGYEDECPCPPSCTCCTATAVARPGQPETEPEAVVVHARPEPGDNGISRCCGRPPHEFVGERLTRDPDKVTCRGD
jgi:hypothetical protein